MASIAASAHSSRAVPSRSSYRDVVIFRRSLTSNRSGASSRSRENKQDLTLNVSTFGPELAGWLTGSWAMPLAKPVVMDAEPL